MGCFTVTGREMRESGELFVLRFDLANDLGVLRSKGLGEAVVNKWITLLISVTREATYCTLWICRVVSRFVVDVTYNVFQQGIHGDHVDSHGAQSN
jgi:hypothetical protein